MLAIGARDTELSIKLKKDLISLHLKYKCYSSYQFGEVLSFWVARESGAVRPVANLIRRL